jgi:hypothetical protein
MERKIRLLGEVYDKENPDSEFLDATESYYPPRMVPLARLCLVPCTLHLAPCPLPLAKYKYKYKYKRKQKYRKNTNAKAHAGHEGAQAALCRRTNTNTNL